MKNVKKTVKIVEDFYDEHAEQEWTRLERRPIEFQIAKRFLSRVIQPGDRVLDMGGGPGRYALWLAEMGCQVTLADLSLENITLAKKKAEVANLSIRALQLDARQPDALKGETFDHILLFGPLYHLLDERDRRKAVETSLAMLKPGGTLACTFISSYTSILYYLKNEPQRILDDHPFMKERIDRFIANKPFRGHTFTQVYYTKKDTARQFMQDFPLEELYFLAMEGMLAPFEKIMNDQPDNVVNAWIDIAEQVCQREDLLSWAEHFLYIGRKPLDN